MAGRVEGDERAIRDAGMQPVNWPRFHIHSIVGTLADGRPLVGADSEHLDAKLDGRVAAALHLLLDPPA